MSGRNKVIFLCTGNICRSPMGEALLKAAAGRLAENPIKPLEIVSAGTTTTDGMRASANAVEALRRIGVDLSAHRSTALTQELVDGAFAIFAMAQAHIDLLEAFFKNLPPRVMTLKSAASLGDGDIADPYGGGIDEYLDVRDEIAACMPNVLQYLKNELKKA